MWVSALTLLLLFWRTDLLRRRANLPSRRLLWMLTLGCIAALLLDFHTLFGREVGVAFLTLLSALKLLETRSLRDAILLIYLSFFICLTHFFYSQTLWSAAYNLLIILALMATWLNYQADSLTLKLSLQMAGKIILQAIPLALIIFILFPRIQGPLWGLPQDAYGSSGLSDSMTPGSLSKLFLSDAVAFRASFAGNVPQQNQLYWRGPVLWDFDGRTWTRGQEIATAQALVLSDHFFSYQITLEPHNKRWLFALDMPLAVSTVSQQTADLQLLSPQPIVTRLRYQVRSALRYRTAESEPQLARALALPDGFNPQSRQLAAGWRAQNLSDAAVVSSALRLFSQQNFVYTLTPPELGKHGVDDFLFNTRQGFCEHYAASFVFLMRAAGIPARVVTGYQGGEWNALGGYFILRQADAHAWAEVWSAAQGWQRIDPTAAIAPSRIEAGLRAALPNSEAFPFFSRTQAPWLSYWRLKFDVINYQWNQWVINFDTERQFAFLTHLGMKEVSWQTMLTVLFVALSLTLGIVSFVLLRRPKRAPLEQVQGAYLRFCAKLANVGLPRAAHEGAVDFAKRIASCKPEYAALMQRLTSEYTALRYEPAPNPARLKAFVQAVKQFKVL